VIDISHRFINGRNELFARDLLHDVLVLRSSRRDLSVAWQERVRPCRFKLWESGTPLAPILFPRRRRLEKIPPDNVARLLPCSQGSGDGQGTMKTIGVHEETASMTERTP
jgi:hypothetical protein